MSGERGGRAKDDIALGHEIATLIESRGVRMPKAGTVLAIALGLLAESDDGPTGGDLSILTAAMTDAAQLARGRAASQARISPRQDQAAGRAHDGGPGGHLPLPGGVAPRRAAADRVPHMSKDTTLYRWHWRARLPERRGQLFRVLARGRLNSCLIEFEDGWCVITSRNALRRA